MRSPPPSPSAEKGKGLHVVLVFVQVYRLWDRIPGLTIQLLATLYRSTSIKRKGVALCCGL
uniref:Uncharacterized protein n=1 Tax=Arundo donax TaxID=35708 RepID=A0A0A9C9E5_ARUDO